MCNAGTLRCVTDEANAGQADLVAVAAAACEGLVWAWC